MKTLNTMLAAIFVQKVVINHTTGTVRQLAKLVLESLQATAYAELCEFQRAGTITDEEYLNIHKDIYEN